MTLHDVRGAGRRRFLAFLSAGVAIVVGFSWAPPAAAQPARRTSPSDRQRRATESAGMRDYVAVRSSVDRRAVWIADRFSYVVEVECSHGTDILTEDLSRDRLQMDEIDVRSVEDIREDRGDGRTSYRFTYHLTTYSFEPAMKRIGEMRLRYYMRRPGQRPEDIEPAGEVMVPGTTVVVRSLLPDDANAARYLSDRPPMPRAAALERLQPIGLGLVTVSVVPAVLWMVALHRRWRHRRRRPSVRQLRHDERAWLAEMRALDIEAEAGRREAFDRLSAVVRKHVSDAWGVSADGLTPAEIAAALAAARKDDVSSEAVLFLDTCDKARYGRAEDLPSRAACLAAMDQAEQLIGLGRS